MDLWFIGIAWRLDRVRWVPRGVLADVVQGIGACFDVFEAEPLWHGDRLTDRELAARICSGCSVRDECLELELRVAGSDTVGVWGGMSDDDRREMHPHWLRRGERADVP